VEKSYQKKNNRYLKTIVMENRPTSLTQLI